MTSITNTTADSLLGSRTESRSPTLSSQSICSEAPNSTSKDSGTLKRKAQGNPLYETAMKRSSQKIERGQTDDKFCYLGQTWGEDMREINEHNPTTFLLARRLIEEIITKAHFGELTRATRIVNVEPLSFHES